MLVRIADDDNHLRALVAEQSLGVIYPSVRHDGGTCIACFRPALVMNVRRDATFRFTWRAGESDPVVSRAVSS